MVNLIPIGTVNRSPNENNPSVPPDEVRETEGSKALADDGQPPKVERRRTGDRRRGREDRRELTNSTRGPLTDRRKAEDRRLLRRAKTNPKVQRKPLSRKGKIIDERI